MCAAGGLGPGVLEGVPGGAPHLHPSRCPQSLLRNRRATLLELRNHQYLLTKLNRDLVNTIRRQEDNSAQKVEAMLLQQKIVKVTPWPARGTHLCPRVPSCQFFCRPHSSLSQPLACQALPLSGSLVNSISLKSQQQS